MYECCQRAEKPLSPGICQQASRFNPSGISPRQSSAEHLAFNPPFPSLCSRTCMLGHAQTPTHNCTLMLVQTLSLSSTLARGRSAHIPWLQLRCSVIVTCVTRCDVHTSWTRIVHAYFITWVNAWIPTPPGTCLDAQGLTHPPGAPRTPQRVPAKDRHVT